jgi:hypothetical protein
MCSSQNPCCTDERTTAEPGIVNYKSNLPWELAAGSSGTTSDTIALFIHGHFVRRVYRHANVTGLQVFKVNTSLLKEQ